MNTNDEQLMVDVADPKIIPIVEYLRLDTDPPRLEATVCAQCDAVYLGRRLACSRCGYRSFGKRLLPSTGTVASFTIIYRAPKGIKAPYVSALVRLSDGTLVKSNLVDVAADPAQIVLGASVHLVLVDAGIDDQGTRAVAFAFAPGAVPGPKAGSGAGPAEGVDPS